jgi:hypothetical protein
MVEWLESNLDVFYLPKSHLVPWTDLNASAFYLISLIVLLPKGITRLCPSLCGIPIILDRFIAPDNSTESDFLRASRNHLIACSE